MWSFRLPLVGQFQISKSAAALAMGASLFLLSGCTVEPLNSSTTSGLSGAAVSSSISATLASTSVAPVKTRVGQQVRNELLFAMNGGELRPGGAYRVDLFVTSTTSNLSVQASSLAPTSAQVQIEVRFNLVDLKTGNPVKGDVRRALASFDQTPQSFANERAERDAQNRAAKEVAQQIRLAVSQILATQ